MSTLKIKIILRCRTGTVGVSDGLGPADNRVQRPAAGVRRQGVADRARRRGSAERVREAAVAVGDHVARGHDGLLAAGDGPADPHVPGQDQAGWREARQVFRGDGGVVVVVVVVGIQDRRQQLDRVDGQPGDGGRHRRRRRRDVVEVVGRRD